MAPAGKNDDDIAQAGEYALHLMDAASRRSFAQRLDSEPLLRMLVAEWDDKLAPLAAGFIPRTPPDTIKADIEQVLFGKKARAPWSPWRMLTGSAVAAVLALGVLMALPPVPQPGSSVPGVFNSALTAQIAAADGSLVVLAAFSADTGVLRVERQAGQARPGRVLELWLIAPDAAAPMSLGVLPDAAVSDRGVPAALVPALAGGTLAISDEPVGGSPTGVPTGAVLALGAVVAI